MMPLLNNPATNNRKKSIVKIVVLTAGIGLYVASLFGEAYCTDYECAPAIMALLVGWMGAIMLGAGISWLANPLLVIAWILLARNKKNALVFGLMALIFALLFLSFKTIMGDEAGHYRDIVSVGTGYWLWVASCVTTFVGSMVIKLLGK